MPDAHADWQARLKQLFAEKPKPPKTVKTDPAKPMAQGAKSVGPFAPMLKAAEKAAAGEKEDGKPPVGGWYRKPGVK